MASPSGWNPKTYSITGGGVACELRVTVECTRITTKADSIEITAFVKSALFDVSGATPVLKKSCSAYRQYRFDTNVTTGEVTYVLYTAPASATANTTIGGVSVDIFAE